MALLASSTETGRLRPLVGVVAAFVGAVAMVFAAGNASARAAVNPTLAVTFFDNGVISVTLPDGTPVGAASGSPTVIPAGYYSLQLSGPGGCSELPYFILKGPGENVIDDMDLGEFKETINAYFLPNSTYVWHDDGIPDVLYSFRTSSEVLGAPPAPTVPKAPSSKPGAPTTSSNDIVGSAISPFRGTLVGKVSAAGNLTVAYRGKGITSLLPGRYRITVVDRSSTSGFNLQKVRHSLVSVTGGIFIGKRSTTLRLTSGRWRLSPKPGKIAYAIVVK